MQELFGADIDLHQIPPARAAAKPRNLPHGFNFYSQIIVCNLRKLAQIC